MADPKDVHQDAVNVQKEVAKRAEQDEQIKKDAIKRKLEKAQQRNIDEINRRGGDPRKQTPPKKKKGS